MAQLSTRDVSGSAVTAINNGQERNPSFKGALSRAATTAVSLAKRGDACYYPGGNAGALNSSQPAFSSLT